MTTRVTLVGLGLAGVMAFWAATGVGQAPVPLVPRADGSESSSGGATSTAPTVSDGAGFVAAADSGGPQVGAAGDMIGFSHSDGSGMQTITLVHTGKSWMAVYHIDRTGQIRLVSSRPIDADFSLQLNATSPLPQEIRKMGEIR